MKENIQIGKIILFDDNGVFNKNGADEGEKYVMGIKKIMKRSLSKARTLTDFSIANDFAVEFYYLSGTECMLRTLTEDKEIDWYNHLADIFNDDKIGYLVLCDFGWKKGKYEETNKKIYEYIRQKENVVFICYTCTYAEAMNWLKTIREQEHKCKIVDVIFSMPKDVDGKIRSMEEAILDEW